MTPILIRGALVADPHHGEARADVRIAGGRITHVEQGLVASDERVLDADGLVLVPGAIDAHSHGDALVLQDHVQEALLRQGVTTIIVGQDGVSFAPGDGTFASDYFGPLNGRLPSPVRDVAGLLSLYEGSTRLGVGYLVPAGTVRHEVMGAREGRPTRSEMRQMVDLVARGLAQGALGLSTGLDYAPGGFADTDELIELCREVAKVDGVHASHMRGYEQTASVGFTELARIASASGVRSHISHFHAPTEVMRELLHAAHSDGLDISFDAYPYTRGFSLLGLIVLPRGLALSEQPVSHSSLGSDPVRKQIMDDLARRWAADGIDEATWAHRIQLASAGGPVWEWCEGLTLAEASARTGRPAPDLAIEMLVDSELTATAVVEFAPERTDDDLAEQFALPGACVGSDGIYAGGAPHPRAWGTFARMYRRFVIERHDFSWAMMAELTSARAAQRYGLRDRGRVTPGYRADLAVLDPGAFRDRASYATPKEHAEGVQHVFVSGVEVLSPTGMTGACPGGPARRADRPS